MTQIGPFWRAIEAIHDVVYFAPDAKQRYEALGLRGHRMGYVASRSAALGTPGPSLVTALFHGFAPDLVRRALPDAWHRADSADVLAVRYQLAREGLAPALASTDVTRVTRDLTTITEHLDLAGKPLAAAHLDLPAPDDEIGRLWHAATVVREYRGDCHVAVLTAAGLDGAAANALATAAGLTPPDQRSLRGWTEDEWADAIARLATRGWLDADGVVTDTGRAARRQIEDTTDRVCAAGLDREATGRAITVQESLVVIAHAIERRGGIEYPNPTGVPRP